LACLDRPLPTWYDAGMGIIEAICGKCGEVFIPADYDDTIHIVTEVGDECGGQGEITREWGMWETGREL
jgi:hypothetical protein